MSATFFLLIFIISSYLQYSNHSSFSREKSTADHFVLDLVFLYKLDNNKINCPQLLSKIKFRIPSRPPRYHLNLPHPPFAVSWEQIPRLLDLHKYIGVIPLEIDLVTVSLTRFRKLKLQFLTHNVISIYNLNPYINLTIIILTFIPIS